jgi:hypothetical protein
MYKAIDFFCGGGGMTHGLRQAGIEVIAGVDFDVDAKETYEVVMEPVVTERKEYVPQEETVVSEESEEAVTEAVVEVEPIAEPEIPVAKPAPEPEKAPVTVPANKSYEEMTVEELQAAILEKMAKNGPVTDQMKKTVFENIWHDSLVNWVKSFR